MLDFDRVLLEIGEFGLYQRFVVGLLIIPACFMCAYNSFGIVMFMYTPTHRCSKLNTSEITDFDRVEYGKCHVSYFLGNSMIRMDKCTRWDYDDNIFKFDLVCDRSIYAKNIIAILQLCSVFGCLLGSYIQDKFGRKIAFTFVLVSYVVAGTGSVFMPNLFSFVAMRAIASLHTISGWNITYIWALEYVGPRRRTLVTTGYCVGYGLAMMSLAGWAHFFDDWVTLGVALTTPFALLISYCYFVHESPRWLLSVGRFDEFRTVITTIDRWQHCSTTKRSRSFIDDVIERLLNDADGNKHDGNKAVTYLDLFRGPNLRIKTILISLCWIANALVYTTIAFNTENLGSHLLITWTLTSAVETPATLVNLLVLDRTGRILPMVVGMLVAGLCCMGTAPGSIFGVWSVVALTMVGKLCISMTFGIICQLAGELYPTVGRGVGTGLSSIFGLLGQTTTPYIVLAAEAYKFLPMIVIGIVAILGGSSSLFLPETLGQNMPQSLEDAEKQGKVGISAFKGHLYRSAHLFGCKKSTL